MCNPKTTSVTNLSWLRQMITNAYFMVPQHCFLLPFIEITLLNRATTSVELKFQYITFFPWYQNFSHVSYCRRNDSFVQRMFQGKKHSDSLSVDKRIVSDWLNFPFLNTVWWSIDKNALDSIDSLPFMKMARCIPAANRRSIPVKRNS